MNERIRELALQAGLITEQDDRENWQEYINDVGKFAELIVAECIKLNGKELAMPGHSRMVDVYCDHFGIKF
jgi:hypothetical protein